MKTSIAVITVCLLSLGRGGSQTASTQTTGKNLQQTDSFQIVERGPNHQVWQKTVSELGPSGQVVQHVHKYTELSAGLNYLKNGKWVASDPEIKIQPDGSAAATEGQHQVFFPANINKGIIEMITPDGLHLKSRPVGLAYYDGNKSVLIAELKDSTGTLLSSNQVIYPDAFTDFKADIRYTYSRGGFEQDIILREQPPAPDAYGFNADNTVLEVLTEFFNAPEPGQKVQTKKDGQIFPDTTLAFGGIKMVQGKAISLGDTLESLSPERGIPVSKGWAHQDGRTFLFEDVSMEQIAPELQKLPASIGLTSMVNPARRKITAMRTLPPQHFAEISTNSYQMTKAEAKNSPGFVLDYVTVNSSYTNFTFQGDTTYYISSPVNFYGNTIFEGGAVIKHAYLGEIQINGSYVFKTSQYHPVMFTSMNDNTIGETISGSSGSPGNTDCVQNLYITGTGGRLENLRFRYTIRGVTQQGLDVWNCQFLHCGGYGLSELGSLSSLHNVLFEDCTPFFCIIQDSYHSMTLVGDNITVDQCSTLINSGSSVYITNSLLTGVGSIPSSTTNNPTVVVLASGSGVYKSVGAGNYYLATNSPYRDAGTTNIPAAALANLKTRTTYAPAVYSNVAITSNTTWGPSALRDTGLPDIGYHYDPIDVVVDGCTLSNATLNVTNGAVVAGYNNIGIWLADSSSLVSLGTATAQNGFIWYGCVQEQASIIGSWGQAGAAILAPVTTGGGSTLAKGNFRFTQFDVMANGGYLMVDEFDGNTYGSMIYQDCSFWSGYNYIWGPDTLSSTTLFKNNLFFRCQTLISGDSITTVTLTNNLFYGGTYASYNNNYSTFRAFNNAFDGCTISPGDMTSSGFNAYINSSGSLNYSVGGDITLGSFVYTNGPFGNFYQVSTNLINKGNTNANLIGLYHYTTQLSQVKESNSIVDIGLHYVATVNGVPADTDGDGIPDYIEDANGNGVFNAGETDWNDYYNGTLPQITIVSGNGQSGSLNAFLSQALTVHVATTNGTSLTNAPLTFSVLTGLNQLSLTNGGTVTSNVSLVTDLSGNAAVYFFLPTNAPVTNVVWVTAQSGTNKVQITFAEFEGHVATPTLSPNGGTFAVRQTVTFSCGTPGAIMYYTTNGVTPTQSDVAVTNGQTAVIPLNRTVKVIAYANSILLPSAVQTVNFTITGTIAAGRKHTLALQFDQTVLAGGSGGNGQIGDSTTHLRTKMVDVLGVSNVVGIAAGQLFSYAWKADGTAWALAWGDDRYSEMGNGTSAHEQTTAVQISNLTSVVSMAGGFHHGLAVTTNGTVWAWGDNSQAQLGDGTYTGRSIPVRVTNLTSIVAVAAGSHHSLALRSDGTVWGWGYTRYGSAGDGSTPMFRTIPVKALGLTNVSAIAAGHNSSLAISNGMVWFWGQNGPLGYWYASPIKVSGLSNIVGIAAGRYHYLALRSDGTVWAWGYNAHGQLGDGSINSRSTVAKVLGGLSNVVAVAAGGEHSVALKSDGTIVTWGFLNYGEEVNWTGLPLTPEPGLHINGPTAPRITTQPVSQSAMDGDSVSFTVVAAGTKPLSYQWYFNGSPITSATSATLTLSNIFTSNAGTYFAVVSNAVGSVTSSSATLTVTVVAPVIVQKPIDTSTFVGQSASLSVTATGTRLTYQWNHLGTPVSGGTNATLVLTSAQTADAGDYTVVVANAAGSANSGAQLLVVQLVYLGGPMGTFNLYGATPGSAYDIYLRPSLNSGINYRLFFCGTSGQTNMYAPMPTASFSFFEAGAAWDTDGDGLMDGYEALVSFTDYSTKTNTDSDGMPDGWEAEWGLNPALATGADGSTGNPDGDGLNNLQEYQQGKDPFRNDSVGNQRPVVSVSELAGVFVITRTNAGNSLTNSLTVNYCVGGPAVYNTAYTLNPNPGSYYPFSITIPANSNSVTLKVNPSGSASNIVMVGLVPFAISDAAPTNWTYVVNPYHDRALLYQGYTSSTNPLAIWFSPLTDGQTVSNLSTIGGIVLNDTNLNASVVFSIQEIGINGCPGRWWNGTNFQDTAFSLPASINGVNWAPAPGVVLPALNSGQYYQLTATVTNTIGNSATATITVNDAITTLSWDPGLTALGLNVVQNPNTNGGDYWFSIYTQTPSIGVWRTALNVLSGQAGVYMNLGSQLDTCPGSAPNIYSFAYASANPGSNGFVVDASQFSAGQNWYILVHATPGSRWNLVSGDAYAYNLGALASDASSSTNVSIGAEGMVFYKTTVPANVLAWQLWINNLTNTIYVKKSSAPDPVQYDLVQAGQMLVVPPYLASGTFNGYYFVGIPGSPGTAIPLDSRQQPITQIPFNSVTNLSALGSTYPYVTYQVQVPINQIGWQLNVAPSIGQPDIAVRRDQVPNEFRNDAFSETPGGSVGSSLALVPGTPGLSDGTWYVTVYRNNTNGYSCIFTNGDPVVTVVDYVFCIDNDDTNRVGWRYYKVLKSDDQISDGWVLDLTHQVSGTKIAIRRNALPGEWSWRNSDNNYGSTSQSYQDQYDYSGELTQVPHDSDFWYIGIYTPAQPLGGFTLCGTKYINSTEPPPCTNEFAPITLSFDGAGNSVTMVNQTNGDLPCLGRYFKVVVPANSNLLGWDLRLTNITQGAPKMVVARDIEPVSMSTWGWGSCNSCDPWHNTDWPSSNQWQAGVDWTGDYNDPSGNNADVNVLAMGIGNPLKPGTYYIGVADPDNFSSYTLVSRGIGLTNASPQYTIPVLPLGFVGTNYGTNLPPREAAYHKVVIPTNCPSWRLKLAPTNNSDVLLVVQQNYLPNVNSGGSAAYGNPNGGFKSQRTGNERYLLLPQGSDSSIPAGTYYIGVVSEGTNSYHDAGDIGTGSSSYALTSLGSLPVINMGIVSATDLVITNFLEAYDVSALQFTMPAGLESGTNRVSMTVTVTDPDNNAQYWMVQATNIPTPGFGGVEGGYYSSWNGTSNVLINPATNVYTLSVQSPSNVTYVVRVHIQTIVPTSIAFDGAGNHASVTNQPAGVWRFFKVSPRVPNDANLLGWDVRLTNITAGTSPQMVVCRDIIPTDLGTWYWGECYYTCNPWHYTDWPSSNRWQAGVDWTGDYNDPSGNNADVNVLAMGVGNPLIADSYSGSYYVGVYDDSHVSSYTLVSRGIGLTNASPQYSIPVLPLGFIGTNYGTNLPPREAAYYKVVVPVNTPSWRVRVVPTNDSDALLVVQQSYLPNVVSGGNAVNGPSGGFKAQKGGNEHYLLLPQNGQPSVPAGTYYLGVVSEGIGSDHNYGNIGTGNTTYSVSSLGALPVVNMGTAGVTDLLITNTLEGGDVAAYQFTMPTGLENSSNRVEMSVVLTDPDGNAQYWMVQATNIPAPGFGYGVEGGYGNSWSGTSNNFVNPTEGVYTLSVQSMSDAINYTVRVHLQIIVTTSIAFDGSGNHASVTNQPAGVWRYFKVSPRVPNDANLLGWDVRLTNITAGVPQMVVRRDTVPVGLGTGDWGSCNTCNPWHYTDWPSSNQWQAGVDWTGYYNDAFGANADINVLAMGIGNPLIADSYSGDYYVGVYDDSHVSSYTLVSRGIGLTNATPQYSIPVLPLNFSGSITASNLPTREAAYYKVVIPANTASWRVKLVPTNSEAMLMVQQSYLPNVGYGPYPSAINGPTGGYRLQKAGNEHYLLLPQSGQTSIPAGTYYLGVVSEGVNPNFNNNGDIGTGNSSYTLSSGPLSVTNLGTVASTDLLVTNVYLEAEDVAAYHFVVPATSMGVEVLLQNRSGHPMMSLLEPDSGIATPYGDEFYGVEGGQGSGWHSDNLITIPNPVATNYSLVVKSIQNGGLYTDATYDLRVHPIVPSLLNIASTLNTNGASNVVSGNLADTESAFFRVVVPATLNGAPILGWQLNLSETNGTPSIRVRPGLLPDDTSDTTSFSQQNSLIVAPPYLTPGTWYVEVKGTGGPAAYSVVSSVITTNTMQHAPWTMPMIGQTNVIAGVTNPVFADSGELDLAKGQYHFYAVTVPTNNAGLLHAELQGINDTNPKLLVRVGSAPTTDHCSAGSACDMYEHLYDRQLNGSHTQYGSWVPIDGKTDSQLTPGLYVISVFASDANVRYRLILSCGNSATNSLMQDLPLNGSLTYSNQSLLAGDWRYYRVVIPTNAPNNLVITWTNTTTASSSPLLYIRDTVPPGQGDVHNPYSPYIRTWTTDNKNPGYDHPDGVAPGSITLTTPPLRPGAVYYFGIQAQEGQGNDARFNITCSTNGGIFNVAGTIAYQGGTVSNTIPGNGVRYYRMDVPSTASNLQWSVTNYTSTDLIFMLEQGTPPDLSQYGQWNSFYQANDGYSQSLTDPNNWPWLPGYSYYFGITNTSSSPESYSITTH